MVSTDTAQCGCITSTGLERLRYFPRQLLTADEMRAEQEYLLEKQRRHNRFLHGWGVVCGLIVQANPSAGALVLTICPGYALSPCGNEIFVPEPVTFDLMATLQQLAQPACANPGLSATAASAKPLHIMIRYAECQTRPLRTLPAGCGCDDSACEFSRIRDGFEIRAWPTALAESGDSKTLCDIQDDININMPPMPPKPNSDWVELAKITFTAGKLEVIDNSTRRVLYSTAQIQAQVISDCNKA